MVEPRRLLEELGVEVVWADSLGAKSLALSVGRPGCKVLVDPGAAAMHPSYPLGAEEKRRLRREALRAIASRVAEARLVVVTHYHYDHYVRPWDPDYPGPSPYEGRLVVAKNPNAFINESQRGRAIELYERLLAEKGVELRALLEPPEPVEPPDYEAAMPLTARASKPERLEAGRRWLRSLAEKWSRWPRLPPRLEAPGLEVVLADEGSWEACGVRVTLLGPHFHGDIYERTGWVVPVLVEHRGSRILYTSDLMGPLSEDYAEEAIRLKPRVIIADGPATYLPPRMFPRRALERAKANMARIVEESGAELIIWDHHLPREPRWRERVEEVFRVAERAGVWLGPYSWLLGEPSLAEKLRGGSRGRG